MDIKRREQLRIYAPNGDSYYGGDQNWYSSNTRAMGGCGSVAGANALRALIRTNLAVMDVVNNNTFIPKQIKDALCSDKPSKEDYTLLMTGVYSVMGAVTLYPLNVIYDRKERGTKLFQIIRPNQGQLNSGFIIGVIRFAQRFGINIAVKSLNTVYCDEQKARDFIKKGLEEAGAVVMLTSFNKHSAQIYPGSTDLDKKLSGGYSANIKSHFVTITDIDDEGILLTTWGKPARCDFNEVVKSWQSIKAFEATLMYVTPSTKKQSIICALSAFNVYLAGIIKPFLELFGIKKKIRQYRGKKSE